MNRERIDGAARYIAAKGKAELIRIREIVERAQRLLDEGGITQSDIAQFESPPPFPWERQQLFPVGAERQIFQAITLDTATGEGFTLHFYAGLARNEAELRQLFAAEVGRWLANAAVIAGGTDVELPHAKLFMSSDLRHFLEHDGDPDRQAAILTYSARLHLNAS